MAKGSGKHLAKVYRNRLDRLGDATRRGLRKAAIAVDRAQVDNLRGGNDAGDYPIPVRTGNLMGSHFFRVIQAGLAVVGNTAVYAVNVHEGKGSSKPYGRRPFLDDAVAAANPTQIMAVEIRKAVMAL